ncbi:hypothetical protein [Microlunatus speluncae]|uniref:hypothetical protein n=1 Tax=Microlunatus speluncae TaxID=2594267 RepID=UPI0014784A2D|nr:hypothetical protein [Microlunatus speluncae]
MSDRRSSSALRRAVRLAHVGLGAALGLLVYLPVALSGGLKIFLMAVGLPLAVLSGLWLWQQGRIRRWFGRRRLPARTGDRGPS